MDLFTSLKRSRHEGMQDCFDCDQYEYQDVFMKVKKVFVKGYQHIRKMFVRNNQNAVPLHELLVKKGRIFIQRQIKFDAAPFIKVADEMKRGLTPYILTKVRQEYKEKEEARKRDEIIKNALQRFDENVEKVQPKINKKICLLKQSKQLGLYSYKPYEKKMIDIIFRQANPRKKQDLSYQQKSETISKGQEKKSEQIQSIEYFFKDIKRDVQSKTIQVRFQLLTATAQKQKIKQQIIRIQSQQYLINNDSPFNILEEKDSKFQKTLQINSLKIVNSDIISFEVPKQNQASIKVTSDKFLAKVNPFKLSNSPIKQKINLMEMITNSNQKNIRGQKHHSDNYFNFSSQIQQKSQIKQQNNNTKSTNLWNNNSLLQNSPNKQSKSKFGLFNGKSISLLSHGKPNAQSQEANVSNNNNTNNTNSGFPFVNISSSNSMNINENQLFESSNYINQNNTYMNFLNKSNTNNPGQSNNPQFLCQPPPIKPTPPLNQPQPTFSFTQGLSNNTTSGADFQSYFANTKKNQKAQSSLFSQNTTSQTTTKKNVGRHRSGNRSRGKHSNNDARICQ